MLQSKEWSVGVGVECKCKCKSCLRVFLFILHYKMTIGCEGLSVSEVFWKRCESEN